MSFSCNILENAFGGSREDEIYYPADLSISLTELRLGGTGRSNNYRGSNIQHSF
jgi:hypothetical protein